MGKVLVGCSGWSYGDKAEKGGWVGSFYPNSMTKKLPYYSRFFNTAEFDAIYYKEFYSKMGRSTFAGMINATPANFEFSVKVPETITKEKKLSIDLGAMSAFDEFLEQISRLKQNKKLGAVLFQMSPNFTIEDYSNLEKFLERLPSGYDYALEFRHASWQTEGALELLRQHNIASVMTDSPEKQLEFLSETAITANHAFIRIHGRNKGFWYNYLYDKNELELWAEKVKAIREQIKTLRIYFNNHYAGKAVVNALEFKEMTTGLSNEQSNVLERARAHVTGEKPSLDKFS